MVVPRTEGHLYGAGTFTVLDADGYPLSWSAALSSTFRTANGSLVSGTSSEPCVTTGSAAVGSHRHLVLTGNQGG